MSTDRDHASARRGGTVVIGLAIAVAAAALTWSALSAAGPTSAPAPVRLGHGADVAPSESAADWVGNADHVVLVTPVRVAEVAPSTTEVSRGEGLIGRTLTMRVDQRIWSRSGAPTAPATFDWRAPGWQFEGGNQQVRVPLGIEGAPRLETNHQYVIALRWQPAACEDGEAEPAQWEGLGADAMLPADGAIIGQGETEGRVQSAAAARSSAQAATGPSTLEEQMAGRDVAALADALQAAARQTSAARVSAAATPTPVAC